MEKMNANLFKFDLGSPSNARGTGNFKGLSKKKFQIFSEEKCGIKETAELYSEASVQNEYSEIPSSVDCCPVSVDKQIKSMIRRIKRRIEAKINVISFQKLNEAVSHIFRSLNDLETRITKQINQAAWNHNSRLKNMQQVLQEQLLQEIKLLVHQEGDIQRQQFKDLHSDIMAIKSSMKAMAREKHNFSSRCSVEKECAEVEEHSSAKGNFSEKHTEHKNGKESSQEAKNSVKYDKDMKVLTNEDLHETLLQEHQLDDLQQVPCRIEPGHSHKMDENVVVDIENNSCSPRKGHEAEHQYDKDMKVPTDEDFHETSFQEHQSDELQQAPCRIEHGHSHKMDENVVVDIKNNSCSLRKGHEAGNQQTGKEGENADIIMPDIYCNDSANIPVCLTQEEGNVRPAEINIQNELHSLLEVCEAGEQKIGNEKEHASIDMASIDCNDGADIQDNLSHEDKVGDNACPSKAHRRHIILKTKMKKFDLCMPAQKQKSTKCVEDRNNCGIQCNIEVSPRTMGSNSAFSQIVSRSKNKPKHNKQGTLHNRMGTKLSSVGNCNRCDLIDLPQTNGDMNQLDKGIMREQNWEGRDPKDIPGNRFSDCVQNKDACLNSNNYEKQTSNTAENTDAFGEKQTEQQTSMKKRKAQPDLEQVPTNGKHHPAKKKVKSQAAYLRRPSHRFHESEVECLIAAVEKFGTGRWRDIKEKYFSKFQFRTAADLKDKWRSLLYSAANVADNRKFRATVPVNLLKRVLAVHEKN